LNIALESVTHKAEQGWNLGCMMEISELRSQYRIRPGVTYLNHGSFGISPDAVKWSRQRWIEALDQNPMDFYVRQFETLIEGAKCRLADFLGADPANLVFSDNATTAMNIVATHFPLAAGDEILINSHEYGAVKKIWQRRCQSVGAHVVEAALGNQFQNVDQIIDPILNRITPKTKLVILSHITSATAIVFPIEQLIARIKKLGVSVCIDGPHAIAALPLALEELGCDFYCASCHKWLAGPLGSGFVYVAPASQHYIQPLIESWGRLLPNSAETWDQRFLWQGTRDVSPYLALPAAIDFLEGIGLDKVRGYCLDLTKTVRSTLTQMFGQPLMVPDEDMWMTTMAQVTLPPGDWQNLQAALWQNYQIEVPIIHFQDQWYIRVSSYLYNNENDLDYLVSALRTLVV